jgi:hypothetical protein
VDFKAFFFNTLYLWATAYNHLHISSFHVFLAFFFSLFFFFFLKKNRERSRFGLGNLELPIISCMGSTTTRTTTSSRTEGITCVNQTKP